MKIMILLVLSITFWPTLMTPEKQILEELISEYPSNMKEVSLFIEFSCDLEELKQKRKPLGRLDLAWMIKMEHYIIILERSCLKIMRILEDSAKVNDYLSSVAVVRSELTLLEQLEKLYKEVTKETQREILLRDENIQKEIVQKEGILVLTKLSPLIKVLYFLIEGTVCGTELFYKYFPLFGLDTSEREQKVVEEIKASYQENWETLYHIEMTGIEEEMTRIMANHEIQKQLEELEIMISMTEKYIMERIAERSLTLYEAQYNSKLSSSNYERLNGFLNKIQAHRYEKEALLIVFIRLINKYRWDQGREGIRQKLYAFQDKIELYQKLHIILLKLFKVQRE